MIRPTDLQQHSPAPHCSAPYAYYSSTAVIILS